VASLTRRFVEAVAGTGATVLDTRKTTPGLRFLEKYAVKVGGGENHRLALWDMYLVKDNHIRAAGGITAAIDRISRTRQGDLLLEVEVESPDQLKEALRVEVDRILVDNQPIEEVRQAVTQVDRWCREHPPDSPRMRPGARRWPEVEVSGGIRLENARAYAETGVDYLSVGALTHSAPALDLSLEVEEVG
jgi:nicotinate-nucleotide pyrophosphorylase (carboxylating)